MVENVFLCICAYFQTTRIKALKNYFFNVWSGSKRVFKHLRILPDQQNQVIENYFFLSGVVKTCFDAFPDHQNLKSLKKKFLTSGVVQNVFLCICAYFQTTRIKSLKKFFFHLWSGKNVFPDHQNQVL